MPSTNFSLIWTIFGIYGALLIGTIVRIVALRHADSRIRLASLASLRSWWIIAIALTTATLFGKVGIGLILGVVGALALTELLRLASPRSSDVERIPVVSTVTMGLIPIYYGLLMIGQSGWVIEAAPYAFVVLLGGARTLSGLPTNYVRSITVSLWGLILFVYCLSHAWLVCEIHAAVAPGIVSAGPFLFLVLLTESNDIAQALVGRQFGRTKLVLKVSPNKSLEGLLGGIVVSMLVSVMLAPQLTAIGVAKSRAETFWISAILGAMVSLLGFLGDMNMAAMKRDVGVKDSGDLLPGQGGMIDRVNSLTFAAPAYYYFMLWTT